MKKQGIKLTSKVLTGLVLLTGITSLPTNAVEVKTAAVDVNKASVKAKVYELNGHYYAKLVADKEVANVIARITTETKSEFVLKKDLIKAGEEVVVELDMTAKAPTRKLPNTEVKREGYTAVNKVGTHTFNINVRYEIATDEVKAKQKETPKPVNEPKKEDTPETSATNDQSKGNEAATKSEQPAATTPAENTKSAEAPKKAETTVARPNTSDNEKPADKPADLVKKSTKPVAGTDRSAVATPAKEDTKAVERKAQAVKEEKAATKTETEKPKQQTPAAPAAGSREEQIRKAGYQVDDYDLKMMDRIPELKTLGKNKLSIESPIDKTIHIFTDGNHDLIIFNKDMNITGSVMNQGKDKPSRKLTEEEKSKYEKEIKQEINKLLDDVYKAGEK